ncbi:hypothetical protein FM101_05110 [Arthrobacter rhombi]|uniref:Uncharacterized protein n=1 Tax=Arthrobacter rhombi TaxID=71253 RepID=A0A1R4FPS4_9MICC|nr:hypothetical protein FM101_05110 [Arthrobacter rhombi]
MRANGLRAVRTEAWKAATVQDPQAKTSHIGNLMLDENGGKDFPVEPPRHPAGRGHHLSANW